MKRYLLNALIAIDQLLNVLIALGEPDETLSSVAWRMERDGKPWGRIMRPVIDTLFWWDPQHCFTSYLAEKKRNHLPTEYR